MSHRCPRPPKLPAHTTLFRAAHLQGAASRCHDNDAPPSLRLFILAPANEVRGCS